MPLGDSITAGAGSSTGAGYRLPLWTRLSARQMKVDFVGSAHAGAVADPDHEGHSGYMIGQLRDGIDGWISAARPDIVLVHAGINDVDRGQDKAQAASRLIALADRIHADRPTVIVIVQGLIPTTVGLEAQARDFNAEVRNAAAIHRFRWVEPPALAAGEMADGLHPNDKGYERMAQAFAGAVSQAPAGATRPASTACLPAATTSPVADR